MKINTGKKFGTVNVYIYIKKKKVFVVRIYFIIFIIYYKCIHIIYHNFFTCITEVLSSVVFFFLILAEYWLILKVFV